jgi:hypothetical protein
MTWKTRSLRSGQLVAVSDEVSTGNGSDRVIGLPGPDRRLG